MTNHYDELRVAPDPEQAEVLRQRLHARMANVSRDDRHGRADLHLESARPDPDAQIVPMEDFASDTSIRNDRTHRRRLVMAAAAIAVVIGAVGYAVSIRGSGHDDSSLSVTAPRPAPPPPREEINVTPDAIELGDGLVGGSIAEDDGHLYVLAGRVESDMDYLSAPEEAVLAAFDAVGTELWRTQLDGSPGDVVVVDGDLWVSREDTRGEGLSRIDASDGRELGHVTTERTGPFIGAFGSVWMQLGDVADPAAGPPQLLRLDADGSTTTIELPAGVASGDSPAGPAAGAGAIWVPLKQGGMAVIDPDTDEVTVIPVADLGHWGMAVVFDGEVAYVTDGQHVTSIVDGEVLATVSPGGIRYLGPLDGAFGVLLADGGSATDQFEVLQANEPMVVAHRQISIPDQARGGMRAIDGEAWWEVGRNYSLRRVEFVE